ncbi:MAG TPA: Hpt domain-containing protein, partial [Gemmataceae bacterium]|nr:Hpt domain-containing protein [Gemmataceae bacterium]
MTGIDPGMFELFREEVRAHTDTLGRGLLDLEADPGNPNRIEPLMRAAHSVKGAARIVGIEPAVRLAHVMEDALVAAQAGKVRITPADIDTLLKGADLLGGLAGLADSGMIAGWVAENEPAVARLEPVFRALAGGKPRPSTEDTVRSPQAGDSPGVPHSRVMAPAEVRGVRTEVVSAAGDDQYSVLSTPYSVLPQPPTHDPAAIPPNPLPPSAEPSMLDVFREEARTHLLTLSAAADGIASGSAPPDDALESLRQLRGAALVMKSVPLADAAGAVSAFLQGIRDGRVKPSTEAVGWLRYAVAVIAGVIGTDEEAYPTWLAGATGPLVEIANTLRRVVESAPSPLPPPDAPKPDEPRAAESHPAPPAVPPPPGPVAVASPPPAEAVVRVTAQSLNRLMGLAGESLVQARWLPSFSADLLALKKHHDRLAVLLDGAVHAAAAGTPAD